MRPRGLLFAFVALLALTAAGGYEAGRAARPPQAAAGGDARPPPPYRTFDGLGFEPSAIAYDPAADRFLVFSDKDFICYRYRLAKDGGALELAKGELHREIRLPGGEAIMKFEAVTRLEDGRFLAITAFDRPDPDFRRLVRLTVPPRGPVAAEPVELDVEAIAARIRAYDPSAAWWKVEGLATTPGDRDLLVAIRSVGESWRRKRDVAWILRCPRTERGFGPPDRLVEYDVRAALGREEGASSLERDPAIGSYLLLTSWESGDSAPEDHGGHLFRLERTDLEDPKPEGAGRDPRPLPAPLASFRAKPEGLAPMPDGRALVVFDDDSGGWKSLFAGYDRSQGLFAVVSLRPLRDAPGAGGGGPGDGGR